jgi:hypothetical protein
MKKNISQTVFMLFVICALSTKMTAQKQFDFSKPQSKNLSPVKKDTVAHEKNLLYMPTRDGNHLARNLFYNPQKDGKVNAVLLTDSEDVFFRDASFEKAQFDVLLSDIKLRKEKRDKEKKTVK